jgi:hypothetical protein
MREELGNQRLRLLRWEGGVSPEGRTRPELDPTKPAKMVPSWTRANTGELRRLGVSPIHPIPSKSNRSNTRVIYKLSSHRFGTFCLFMAP